MIEKTKRKRTARRPIWQVVGILLLIVLIAGIGVYFYLNTVAVNDGEDIVFLRASEGYNYNLYVLDIDNEEAEARALTDYDLDTTMSTTGMSISTFDVSPDGTWLVYDEQVGGTIISQLVRQVVETGEKTVIWDCSVEPLEICWEPKLSPDGQTLVFGASDGEEIFEGIGIMDLSNPEAIPEPLFQAGSWETFWIGNDSILTKRWEDETMIFYNIKTGDIEPYESENPWRAISPDGSRVLESSIAFDMASGDTSWTYQVLNTENNDVVTYQLPIGTPQMPVLAWHPDNTKILISSIDMTADVDYNHVYLFDTETEETTLLFDQNEFRVKELVWNPDGTQFVMVLQELEQYSQEGQIWIFDMKSGEARPTHEIGWAVQWLNS